jgi:hypothetical protein
VIWLLGWSHFLPDGDQVYLGEHFNHIFIQSIQVKTNVSVVFGITIGSGYFWSARMLEPFWAFAFFT